MISIRRFQTSAYYPNCNGCNERYNKEIVNYMRILLNEDSKRSLASILREAVTVLRKRTVTSRTPDTPRNAFFGLGP